MNRGSDSPHKSQPGKTGASTELQMGSPTTPLRSVATPGKIQLTELFWPDDERRIRLASQVGIRYAIVNVLPALTTVPANRYIEVLRKIKSDFQSAGMTLAGVESHPVPAEKIKLGLAGRDEEIDHYISAIQALAEIGVPMICYNWMAGLGWYRTNVNVAGRGGALITEFDAAVADQQGLTEWGQVSEEKIWSNLEYFLKTVLPAAEQAGVKMALHPDDPPLSPLRGIGRILTSADSFRRILETFPSPVNGITFCQANFKLMGEDIAKLVHEWCAQKKIFFVHLRDVEGTRERFKETFHDDGPVDLAQMLRLYYESGFEGPMRPDHAPTLEGETNDRPGYAMAGKLFAFGYMKGAMDAFGIPYT
jgi:D-mannonate dehydratase